MTFPKYLKYAESGVEWVGEVPQHWEVRRLKSLVEEPLKYGANESAELDDRSLPRFVRITDIDNDGGLKDETFKSLPVDVAEPYLLRDGDVLLARSGATVGKSFIYREEWGTACFAGYLIRARLRQSHCSPTWLYYFCQTDGYWDYVIGSQIQATIQNVSAEKYANLYLPLPSIGEQAAIAAFLDRETAKIDGLVGEQRRLIELLKEKRQAVISHAVTKGPNLQAKMKPSGIERLGDVPANWSVKTVRHACRIDNTLRFPIDAQSRRDIEGDFPYFGPTGILSWINEYRVDGDYFLIGEDGDHFLKFAQQPMTVRVTGKFNVNNHAHLLRGCGECSTDWAATYFKHMDLTPWLIKQGVGRMKLRKETLQTIPILIPPPAEQTMILAFLDAETEKFDALIAEAESGIELLRERRTALISAAVTGKIDVRGIATAEAA